MEKSMGLSRMRWEAETEQKHFLCSEVKMMMKYVDTFYTK
jgi:hypothetical protein